ncbi:MAG: gliding motility-associated C-terminal domain-containing protein, partial [Chitinophagales bacterium]
NGWEVLPWTSVGFELSTYVGQDISIELLTTDCGKGDHAGYAYIDAACLPLDIAFESDICIGEGSATLSVAEGFAEYLWSNGDTERTATIQNAAVGDVVWVELTSFTGCTITLSDTIEAPPNSLEVLLNPIEVTPICEGDTAIIEISGSNLETVYWKDLDIYANPIELNPSSTTTYEIVPIDFNGCQHLPEMVHIVVNPPPNIEISASQENICNGESVQFFLEVNNDSGFRWLDNGNGSPNRIEQPTETGFFYAQADGIGTCPNAVDSILIVVDESQPMTYAKTLDTKICAGESVSLRIEEETNIAAIEWIGLNSNSFSVEVSPVESRYFYVDLTADGCSYVERDSIFVAVILPLEKGLLGENRCIDASVLLDVGSENSEATYLWQDGSTNSTFEVAESGTYSVEIRTDCEIVTESVELQMATTSNCSFEIPSAFSPNEDGINDVLQVVTNCSNIPVSRFTFKVFNRWGEVVFETNDVAQAWNGSKGFNALPNGLYVWWLNFEGESDGVCSESVFKKGNVVLIR